jgi:hypothetical protein
MPIYMVQMFIHPDLLKVLHNNMRYITKKGNVKKTTKYLDEHETSRRTRKANKVAILTGTKTSHGVSHSRS